MFATFSASRICILFAQYKTVGLWSLVPKLGIEVQRICSGSEILSLLWSVNLLSQVCKLIFIKLSWKALILIHFTLSPVIFISIITSIIFSSPGEIPINSIDSPGRVVVGYSTVALSVACIFQFQYQSTNTICEKNKEGWYYFFNYWIISSAGSLLASEIRRVTALQVGRTSSLGPRFPGLTFVFNFSWELRSPQGRPKTML